MTNTYNTQIHLSRAASAAAGRDKRRRRGRRVGGSNRRTGHRAVGLDPYYQYGAGEQVRNIGSVIHWWTNTESAGIRLDYFRVTRKLNLTDELSR